MNFREAVKELELQDPKNKQDITPDQLIEILKNDVVQALEKPGSWEGSNMRVVLESHGLFD